MSNTRLLWAKFRKRKKFFSQLWSSTFPKRLANQKFLVIFRSVILLLNFHPCLRWLTGILSTQSTRMVSLCWPSLKDASSIAQHYWWFRMNMEACLVDFAQRPGKSVPHFTAQGRIFCSHLRKETMYQYIDGQALTIKFNGLTIIQLV